ncbi:hypothetical protein GPALN_013356 [Globodera pallida]|nr:hypothetical protein GPALN_013356 [Globodera pallida]
MHFCLLVSATFVLLMAASVTGSGRGEVKKDSPTGGSRNAQRQQGGSKKNSQTESKTENAGTSQNANTTNTNPAQPPQTFAGKNQLTLSAEVNSYGWQNWPESTD